VVLELLENGKSPDENRGLLYLRVVSRAKSERGRDARQRVLAEANQEEAAYQEMPWDNESLERTLKALEGISERSAKVLAMAVSGMSNEEMRKATGQSESTICRVKAAMRKEAAAALEGRTSF
jgi:ATP/maltotriose-dependent transcriptional regulator MalT